MFAMHPACHMSNCNCSCALQLQLAGFPDPVAVTKAGTLFNRPVLKPVPLLAHTYQNILLVTNNIQEQRTITAVAALGEAAPIWGGQSTAAHLRSTAPWKRTSPMTTRASSWVSW